MLKKFSSWVAWRKDVLIMQEGGYLEQYQDQRISLTFSHLHIEKYPNLFSVQKVLGNPIKLLIY